MGLQGLPARVGVWNKAESEGRKVRMEKPVELTGHQSKGMRKDYQRYSAAELRIELRD